MYKIILLLLAIISFFVYSSYQKVEIIYFYSPDCRLVNSTDVMLEKTKEDFMDKVSIKEINILNPQTEYEEQLKEKFNVKGVPTIIVNGKEYFGSYEYTEFKNYLCKQFFIKPKTCLFK